MQAGGGISGTFKLKGADKLLAALKDLEPKLAKGVLSKAMRAGAKPISLKIRAIKRNRKGRVGVVISTDKGFFKGDTFYAAFHEFGTSRMPARPFIRPAFDAHKVSSVKIIGNEIWSGIRAVTTGAARDSLQGALAE
jgi:HK97 gp10 family phage protein